jgi:PAS domain S-box-containing protein
VDGVRAADEITARLDIPVVYLTAHSDDDTLQRAKTAAPYGYVLKPFLERELQCVIEMALHKHWMEGAVRENERHFRSLIENASDLTLILDSDFTVRYASPSCERVLGYQEGELVGKTLVEFLRPDDVPKVVATLTEVIRDRTIQSVEFLFPHADGSWRVLEATSNSQIDDPAVGGVVVNARDITKRVRAEEALARHQQHLEELVRERTAQLSAAKQKLEREFAERERLEKTIADLADQERRSIGQELHDQLAQELTALGYQAERLHRKLRSLASQATEDANAVVGGIQRALEHARTIAKGLVPVEIGVGGLMAALERLTADAGRLYGLEGRFVCDSTVPIRDNRTATHLFRIAQEAIQNTAKHGQARHVDVELRSKDGRVTMSISDDGVGASDTWDDMAGVGLQIMRHRARVIGATLGIRPANGGGTLVTCTLPRGHDNEHPK